MNIESKQINKQIKEILTKVLDQNQNMRWNIEDAEYFAKLIIKECVQVCEDGKGWVPNLHWIPESAGKYWDQACEHRANAIKKHFGVE